MGDAEAFLQLSDCLTGKINNAAQSSESKQHLWGTRTPTALAHPLYAQTGHDPRAHALNECWEAAGRGRGRAGRDQSVFNRVPPPPPLRRPRPRPPPSTVAVMPCCIEALARPRPIPAACRCAVGRGRSRSRSVVGGSISIPLAAASFSGHFG